MRIHFLVLGFLFTMSSAQANVVGTHFQNFNPTTNGLDFVTVHSSNTLEPGMVNFGGFGNYAFNSLPYFKLAGVPPSTQNFSEPNDRLLGGDLNLGLGLMKGWDAGISFPFVVDQDVKDSASLGAFDETGLAEVRLNTKVRVYEALNWGVALIGSVNFDRIKNNPFTGSSAGPTFNFEGALDHKFSNGWLWAFNAGYRLRDKGDTIPDTSVTPFPDQVIYSSALNIPYEEWKTNFIFEVYGSALTENIDVPTDRKLHNLELLAGAKHMITPSMALHGGLTAGAYRGLASPDFRIYAGLNWQLGPARNKDYVEPAPPPPVAEPVVEEKPSETIVLSSINFATASSNMTGSSLAAFQGTVSQIKKNSSTIRKIIVEGHTDNVGKDDYNQRLSEGRAKSVQAILVKGLPEIATHIKAVGLGETRPIASNDNEAGRSKNRRVEIKIYRNE